MRSPCRAGFFLPLLLLAPRLASGQADRPAIPTHDDPVAQGVQDHLDRLCAAHAARLSAISDEAGLKEEVSKARERFLGLLGLDLDRPRAAPGVTPVEILDFPAYRIEKVIVESAPGVPVPCAIYVPKEGPARKPALICPHGHSGRDRPVYQNGYQRLAKAGFVVLAKDGWGKQERRGTGHGEAGGQLALTGTALMGLELFDNARCLDYLLGRPDVDGERVGILGLSGGGSQTLYTFAVDERFRAASPTCAVTTFQADLADTTMCVCELAQDILTVGDHGLFLAMGYPRPILVVNGTNDAIFPVAGARAAVAQARRLYGAAGHGDRVEFAEYDAPHSWSDAMIDRQIRWFRERFGLPELAEMPPGDPALDPDRLRCYPDGDLPEGSLSLARLNRSRMRSGASRERSSGRVAEADRLKELVRSRWSGPPLAPDDVASRELEDLVTYNLARSRLSWRSGLGGPVKAAVTRPREGAAGWRRRLVIRLERDRQVPRLEALYWDDRIRPNATVVDLSYTGADLAPEREGQVSSALLASGRSLLAERVRDLLVTLEVLRDRGIGEPDGDLVLVGHGFDGVLLLVAAPFLPERARLVLDRSPITYRLGAELDFATPRLLAPPFHWSILPSLASRLDLADLLELASPRPVLLTHPLDSAQEALPESTLGPLLAPPAPEGRRLVEVVGHEQPRAAVFRRISRFITGPAEDAR